MAFGERIYDNGGILKSAPRREILATIKERGCATYSELYRLFMERHEKMSKGTLQYHLEALEKSGVIVKGEPSGRRRSYRISGDYLNVNPQET